jgi:cytochrome P450
MTTAEPEPTLRWGDWDAETRDDPWTWFDAVREASPVQIVHLADGHDAWLVLGYEEARLVLNDHRITKDMAAALATDPDVADPGLPGPELSHHMLNVDPPDHTRLRRIVAEAFRPSRVRMLEGAIRRSSDRLLDRLAEAGPDATVDLVGGYAHPLPFDVIGDLLGVPLEHREELHGWFAVLLAPRIGDPSAEVVAASDHIVDFLRQMVTTARRDPGDDLVGLLVRANDADQLDERELLSTLFQLVVAGHDTTTSLIGSGVVALLDHPDKRGLLLDDPELLTAAIEELLRYTSPVPHATFRAVAEEMPLGDVRMASGRQVLVCLAAANRDPGAFERPDELDLTRDRPQHLAFGHGIHHCLGAPLARLEARIAFGSLMSRFPALRLAVPRAELEWTHGDGLVIRGLANLPVHLGDGPAAAR